MLKSGTSVYFATESSDAIINEMMNGPRGDGGWMLQANRPRMLRRGLARRERGRAGLRLHSVRSFSEVTGSRLLLRPQEIMSLRKYFISLAGK